MLKVLIADDEPKIRKGIHRILEDSALELDLLEPVKNGLLALETAKKEQPDILLVDINMPKKSGLELIDDLRDVLPESHVIIISGHDEFEYAQKAISLKVYDYLLKPIMPEKLIFVVEGLMEVKKALSTKNQYMEWAENEVNRRINDISANLFRNWAHGRLVPLEIKSTLDYLGLNPEDDMLVINIHLLVSLNTQNANWDSKTLFFAIANITSETCTELGIPPIVFNGSDDNLVLMISPVYLSKQNVLIRDIERNIKAYLKQRVFINSKLIQNIVENLPDGYALLIEEQKAVKQYNSVAKEAKKYIDSHYSEETLSLQQVADEMDVTLSYLSRLLKKELNISFTEYLTELRLRKAVDLFDAADSSLKIADVAEAVGYTSQHYFCKVFKRTYNMSPSDYIRKVRDEN